VNQKTKGDFTKTNTRFNCAQYLGVSFTVWWPYSNAWYHVWCKQNVI